MFIHVFVYIYIYVYFCVFVYVFNVCIKCLCFLHLHRYTQVHCKMGQWKGAMQETKNKPQGSLDTLETSA